MQNPKKAARNADCDAEWGVLRSRAIVFMVLFAGILACGLSPNAVAQREPRASATDDSAYGRRFFEQLRTLFGRFRDADLDRAFDSARPIQCSELVSGDGEWRPVAFFNEDRRLGDWYHSSLDEVKAELSLYAFKGLCRGDQSSVQLVTKFPVLDSIERYNNRRIDFDEIRVNLNPAVTAYFEPRSQIYTFDLPFMYVNRERSVRDTVYSLIAQSAEDRPATDVTNHWECKAVRADDVTFQFIICQTWTLPRAAAERRQSRPTFGSLAYFILSDGREASTTVKLVFGGGTGAEGDGAAVTEPRIVDVPAVGAPRSREVEDVDPRGDERTLVAVWQSPDPASRLIDTARREFRMRFSPQTWTGRVGAAQVLSDQKISPLLAARPPANADYCVWQPASAALAARLLGNDPDMDVDFSARFENGDRLSAASVVFEMKTFTGSRLGALQCFFPRTESAETVNFDRWVAVVGAHLTIEERP